MDDVSGAPLKFFDCNMRIGRAGVIRPEHILDRSGLLDEMDYAGLDSALVYHAWSQEWDAPGGNAKLLEEIGDCGKLYPCFVPLPHATDELPPPAEFAQQVQARRGAVRLYPRAHSYSLSDWCMGPTLEALEAFVVPALIEMAQLDWEELARLLKAHPKLPVILLASSYRIDRYIYPLFEAFENLYLETATYQIMRGIEDVTQRFGRRLVFGTGLPLQDAGGPIAQIVYAELPLADKQAIAGGTLARLLGVEWPLTGGAA